MVEYPHGLIREMHDASFERDGPKGGIDLGETLGYIASDCRAHAAKMYFEGRPEGTRTAFLVSFSKWDKFKILLDSYSDLGRAYAAAKRVKHSEDNFCGLRSAMKPAWKAR
jgi:hypothetical protein